jgi:hypothetical protein
LAHYQENPAIYSSNYLLFSNSHSRDISSKTLCLKPLLFRFRSHHLVEGTSLRHLSSKPSPKRSNRLPSISRTCLRHSHSRSLPRLRVVQADRLTKGHIQLRMKGRRVKRRDIITHRTKKTTEERTSSERSNSIKLGSKSILNTFNKPKCLHSMEA